MLKRKQAIDGRRKISGKRKKERKRKSLVTEEEIKMNIGFLGTRGILLKELMKEKLRERRL